MTTVKPTADDIAIDQPNFHQVNTYINFQRDRTHRVSLITWYSSFSLHRGLQLIAGKYQ